jgi:type VI secretion system protein VasD
MMTPSNMLAPFTGDRRRGPPPQARGRLDHRPMAIAVAAILTTSCAGAVPEAKAPEKCPPQAVTVSLLASPRVNPTASGAPRAIVVRLYQLKSDVRLLNAKFEQVWKDDKAALGDDLVKVDEQEVYPATRVDVKFDRSEAVQHIAAVALFQNPQGRSWVAASELPPMPAAGACSAKACDADEEGCDGRAVGDPKLSFFVDGNKIGDGVEQLDQFPTPGPIRGRP